LENYAKQTNVTHENTHTYDTHVGMTVHKLMKFSKSFITKTRILQTMKH